MRKNAGDIAAPRLARQRPGSRRWSGQIYRQQLSGNHLAEFDRALEWAEMGRNSDSADTLDRLADAADSPIAGVERKPTHGPDSSAG